MKKFLWCIASFGIAYATIYTYALGTNTDIDILLWLPLVFIILYLLGIGAYRSLPSKEHYDTPKANRLTSLLIYAVEAVTISLVSVVMGIVFGLEYVATWFAAMLVLVTPSAEKVRHFLRKAQEEDLSE